MDYSAAPFPARPGDTEVERMVYASAATSQNSVYATASRIRGAALRHNPPMGIHAVLLAQSGWFLHWAEGSEDALQSLFARIHQDPRHRDPVLVHASRGRRLLPTPWSMMVTNSAESPAEFGARVMLQNACMSAGKQFSPLSVIRRLTSPMLLPEMQQRPDPDSFHRTGVCAAEGQSSFEFVHWLALRHNAVKVSRRVAGINDLDSSSDYVDFMLDEYPCRVIAVPRSELEHGLRRAFLPDWRLLLLLCSRHGSSNEALLDRVEDAFSDLPCVPELLIFAPSTALLEQVLQSARQRGLKASVGGVPADEEVGIWLATRSKLENLGSPPASEWYTSAVQGR